MMNIRISIVIPNFNNGKTLGRTLKSLVDQSYKDLEIIVIDGGSTDNSLEVIERFQASIAWWTSEADSGQSNAINKGFRLCTGDVVNWLCSDDILTPNALETIGRCFAEKPDIDVLVGAGSVNYVDRVSEETGKNRLIWLKELKNKIGLETPGMKASFVKPSMSTAYIKHFSSRNLALMPAQCSISQPSCFYRRALLDRTAPIDESYHYAMDTELWNYFKACGVNWHCIDDVLSVSIQDGRNKTSTGGYKVALELERIYKTYTKELIPLTFWQKHLRYPLEKHIMKNSEHLVSVIFASSLWLVISALLAPFYGVDKVKAMRWTKWI